MKYSVYRSARLLFAVGTLFALSKAGMSNAVAEYYDPCEEPEPETGYSRTEELGSGCEETEQVVPGEEFGSSAGGGVVAANGARVGGHLGGPDNQNAGAIALFDNVGISLDAQLGDIHDALLGGDGSDANATLWIDSFSGPWRYGLGLTYGYYRVNDRYDVNIESYSADLYVTYDINENLYIGGFVDLSFVDVHDATFAYQGGVTTIGGTETYYGAGILAGYTYTYQAYTFNATSMLASMLKEDLGDLLDEDESVWYTSASVYRPITDQLAVEAFVGWNFYFDRTGGRDETFGSVGGNVIYTITDKWSASIGLETDFAQEDFEGNYLNGSLRYEW